MTIVVEERGSIALNEAHAAHIGGEREHPVAVFGDANAFIQLAKVGQQKLAAKLLRTKVCVFSPI
jgi:hypothetical protein